jgi:hypothetical protein
MAYALPYIIMVLAGSAALLGILGIWVPNQAGRSTGFYLFYGAGLQFLLVLPVILFQAVFIMGPLTPPQPVGGRAIPAALRTAQANQEAPKEQGRMASQPPPLRVALGLAAAPIHLGGATTRYLFETVDGPLRRPDRGYPSSALAGAIPLTAIATFQVLMVGLLFARWFRLRADLKEPRLVLLGTAVFFNALLNMAWPWWGS